MPKESISLVVGKTWQQRYGSWAVVTGCGRAEGLGFGFAQQLAAKGLGIVLVDVLADGIEARAEALRETYGVETRRCVVDLGEQNCMDILLPALVGLDVGVLVANHMWAPHEPPKFLDVSLETHERMLAINARAYVRLAHTFGRQFVERGRGGIILVSSSAALVTAPFTTSYAANKAYQLALGEALWFELQGTGVDLEVLTPGLTQTKLAGMAGFDQRLMMAVEPVVAESLAKLGRRHLVIPGLFNNLVLGIQTRLLPRRRMVKTVGELMRRVMRAESD